MNCPRCQSLTKPQLLHDVHICYTCKVGWSGITLRNATSSRGLHEIKGKALVKILVAGGMPQDVAENLLRKDEV